MTLEQVSIGLWLVNAVVLGIVAYSLSYLKKKGENRATKEDIGELTRQIEAIKTGYGMRLEEYKRELTRREQASIVAALFAEWIDKTPSKKELNRIAWEATLWLPDEIAEKVNRRLANAADAEDLRKILLDIKSMIHGKPSGLKWAEVAYFQ